MLHVSPMHADRSVSDVTAGSAFGGDGAGAQQQLVHRFDVAFEVTLDSSAPRPAKDDTIMLVRVGRRCVIACSIRSCDTAVLQPPPGGHAGSGGPTTTYAIDASGSCDDALFASKLWEVSHKALPLPCAPTEKSSFYLRQCLAMRSWTGRRGRGSNGRRTTRRRPRAGIVACRTQRVR
eukprot:SAG22_NODE_725_length_7622_cov_1.958926_3_plen_178_part_00